MYYNIKIKTIDSEFILESENRRIIEKEMDAYFALFFGVSEDFRAKIKNIDLTKENLVSIDEIEKKEHASNSGDDVVYYESSEALSDSSLHNGAEEIEFIDEEKEPIEIIDDNYSYQPKVEEHELKPRNFDNELILKNDPVIYKSEPEIIDEVKTTPAPQQSAPCKEIKIDFRLFLAGFIISDIFNQFMACVFYIKNILKEDGATLKTINANLIKATGTIASMSVVNDLVDKNYISHKDVDGIKKYFITPLGEEYFTKKYRE